MNDTAPNPIHRPIHRPLSFSPPFREQPPVEYYEFDANLLSEPMAPSVEAGQITVNNLTYQGMKTRLVVFLTFGLGERSLLDSTLNTA